MHWKFVETGNREDLKTAGASHNFLVTGPGLAYGIPAKK